nr:hypothetical protein GCM10020092_019220 [Actinoplanes digitatis]
MDEVEVTFVADATGTEVILEFDKRGGLLAEGRDTYARYRVEHTDAQTADWTSSVQKWIHQAVTSHSASP